MKLRYLLKYIKDYIRLGFNSDGNSKFSKTILKKIKKGFYVDIGCYHPMKDSHTALLYKNGWKGVNIDISKESIEMFNIFRPKDINLNIGISTKNGYEKGYFEKNISTVSSLDKNYLAKCGRKNLIIKLLKVITLNKLRKKYNIEKIDFLKIDCESKDASIIMNSSLKDLECNFLSLELIPEKKYKSKNIKYNSIKNFLKTSVYKKIKKNFIIVDNEGDTFLLKKK